MVGGTWLAQSLQQGTLHLWVLYSEAPRWEWTLLQKKFFLTKKEKEKGNSLSYGKVFYLEAGQKTLFSLNYYNIARFYSAKSPPGP